MALGIAALAVMGLAMTHLAIDPMRVFQLYQLHKSIGITVLLAAIFRLAWRLTHRPPKLPATMPRIEKATASATHVVIYGLLLGLPLSGWALVSASVLTIPTVLYGVVVWPDLAVLSSLEDKAPAEAILKLVHAYGAYALIALIAAHSAAALRHHFLIGDDVLTRMLPVLSRGRQQPNLTTEEHPLP
jgi:cytochrome b561